MPLLEKSQKTSVKKRLRALEKELGQKLDLKELEKRLDFKELEKKLDLKELEKRLPRRHEEPESSSAGFIAGLVVGAIIGAVLAILFGKGGNRDVMDQFVHRAEGLKDTATGKYHQVRGDAEDADSAAAGAFVDEVAIEREVNGEDLVASATDTIDSASDDVHQAVDDVRDTGNDAVDDVQRRI